MIFLVYVVMCAGVSLGISYDQWVMNVGVKHTIDLVELVSCLIDSIVNWSMTGFVGPNIPLI
jgi:hypothetical protein